MPRQTKEIVLSLALALVSLGNIVLFGGTVATIFGIVGVVFFGGGAALLFFRPQGIHTTGASKPRIAREQNRKVTPSPIVRSLNDSDRVAAVAHSAAFQRFGVLAEGVEETDWFLQACADAISPGRPLTPDDVLSVFDELSYYEPNLDRSEVAPNLSRIELEFEGDLDDVMRSLDLLIELIQPDVKVTTELVADRLQLEVGRASATVEMGSILSDGSVNGYYVAAYVALAELYRRNKTGFRLAIMASDFSGYVVRIPEGSVDELNAELGLGSSDYNQLVWLDLPENDLDDMSSVTFEE